MTGILGENTLEQTNLRTDWGRAMEELAIEAYASSVPDNIPFVTWQEYARLKVKLIRQKLHEVEAVVRQAALDTW